RRCLLLVCLLPPLPPISTLFPYTTLFRSQPTFGRVYLRNQDITGIGVTQVCQLGMSKSYQVNTLFDQLTVRQNILMSVLGQKRGDRKSTRLNSSHVKISYAVFCLKKKKKK